jgi:hypothetical protein
MSTDDHASLWAPYAVSHGQSLIFAASFPIAAVTGCALVPLDQFGETDAGQTDAVRALLSGHPFGFSIILGKLDRVFKVWLELSAYLMCATTTTLATSPFIFVRMTG